MEIVTNDTNGKLLKTSKSELKYKRMQKNIKKPSSRIVTTTEETYDGKGKEIFESDMENERNSTDYPKDQCHPVKFGDLYNNRYSVICELGCGYFSTVWLSWDLVCKRFVALKVVRSVLGGIEGALDEISFLKCVQEKDPSDPSKNKIIRLLDDFKIYGVNGVHICIVFEPLGPNLLELFLLPEYEDVSLANVKEIIRQVLQAMEFLHNKCQIIHNDIKLENVLAVKDENYLRKMAYETIKCKKMVINLPTSLVRKAPKPRCFKRKAEKQNNLQEGKYAGKLLCKYGWNSTELNVNLTCGKKVIANALSNECSSSSLSIYGFGIGQSDHCRYNLRSTEKLGSFVSMKEICSGSVENVNNGDFSVEGYLNMSESSLPSCYQKKSEVIKEGTSASSTVQINERDRKSVEHFHDISNISVKIADFGIACWVHQSFEKYNQTAVPYRSLEALLGASYGPAADIWSVACLAFELVTGDFLFNPKKDDLDANEEEIDDDHLTLMIKLLGKIPRNIALSGKCSRNFFTQSGTLRKRLGNPEYLCLYDVLTKTYKLEPDEAQAFSDFIIPMLVYDPKQRATASDCLKHPWLTP